MNTLKKQMMITQILTDNGWDVINISMTGRCEIKANKRWSNINIYTEECMCHGGRMWINEEHTKTNYEISHPAYDESLGITDSSTELEWIIKNEMMEYVNKLSKMVYKLVKINEYGQSNGHDKEDTTYFSSMESIAYRVTDGEDIKDIFMIDKIKHQYPNPNIYCITERIYKEEKYSWEKGRIWFKQTRYERKDEKSEFKQTKEYEMYVDIFNKA